MNNHSPPLFPRKRITSRALLASLVLHGVLLVWLAFVLREAAYPTDLTEPTVTVELLPPRKPQSLQPRLQIEPPSVSFRGQTARQASLKSRPDVTLSPTRALQVTRETPVARNRPDLSVPDASDQAIPWATTAQLEASASELVDAEPGIQQGRGLGAGRPAPPTQARSRRALLDLEAGGDEDDDGGVPFVGEASDEPMPSIRMEEVLRTFAESIVRQSEGGPIDVVFVVDYSGSMQDNIDAVREHLNEMIDVYRRAKLDYALGLVQFHVIRNQNNIRLFHPTQRWSRIRAALASMRARGDEHAFDAIQRATVELRFRPASKRFFILATDEPFTSTQGWTVQDAIAACKEFAITTYVMGLDNPEHRQLAEATEGRWHLIPQRKRPPSSRRVTSARASSRRQAARYLRTATWQGLDRLRQHTLQPIPNAKLDVLWVIDGSRSMEDKLPALMERLDSFFQAWDHALLDYRIGAVRFRAGTGSFESVNFYAPPQGLEEMRKILALPPNGSERLLDALAESLQRMPWRSDAKRYVIVVTDEPSSGQKRTAAEVIQIAVRQRVTVSVVGTVDDFQQEVARQTGGVWVPIPGGYTRSQEAW